MRLTDGHIAIRQLRPSDEPAYCEVLSDPEVSGTLRGQVGPQGKLKLLSTCTPQEFSDKFRYTLGLEISGRPCYFAIEECGSARFVGSIGSYPIDDERLGLSYWIDARHHGRGIGSRALKLYCPAALRHFGRRFVIANVALDNPASKAAAVKAGFEPSRFIDDPGFGQVLGRELLEFSNAS